MKDFEFKKSLGQNFIKDENIINKIVLNSNIDKDTLLLEIGPGSGSLSKAIVPLCGHAILYEIDKRLEDILNDELVLNDNYEIIFGDFLEQEISNLREKYNYEKVYVVANLPYYITTPIITKLLNQLYPDKIVIMVQDEVANRLSATNGSREYGMISVLLGSRYEIKKLFKVSKNCFQPKPNVDSAVIEMKKRDLLRDVSTREFEKLIKKAFQYKRKNLRNNLKEYDLDLIERILKDYGYSLNDRAEDLPISVFINICRAIN